MTPWGEPDLRGIWPLNHLISTPFQRPEKFGDRRVNDRRGIRGGAEECGSSQRSASSPVRSLRPTRVQATRLTSLLVDPPNGRFPALTPKGKELYDQMRGSYKPGQTVFDSPEDSDTGIAASPAISRCRCCLATTTTASASCSSRATVILLEMAHEARIIPTDEAPGARWLDQTVSW